MIKIVLISLLIGITWGVSIIVLIVEALIKKGNVIGDSKGTFQDFTDRALTYSRKEDSVFGDFIS